MTIDPEEYYRCPFCPKRYVRLGPFKTHVRTTHITEPDREMALQAYLDEYDAELDKQDSERNLLEEGHKASSDGTSETFATAAIHAGAAAAMLKPVDTGKLQTFELAKNGSDLLRVMANRIGTRVQGGLSLEDRLDVAQQLHTMANLLESLYQELKNTDLRVLQTKARRWDTVAAAVADSISEASRS